MYKTHEQYELEQDEMQRRTELAMWQEVLRASDLCDTVPGAKPLAWGRRNGYDVVVYDDCTATIDGFGDARVPLEDVGPILDLASGG
jgi:hypothetical protein